jgi:predicted Zn-dependent protease
MSRTPTRQGIRLLPIVVGTVIDLIGTLVATMALAITVAVLRGPAVFDEPPTAGLMAVWTVVGCTFTVLGACVAGLMAKHREVTHGLGVAIFGGVVGLAVADGGAPQWFQLAAVLTGLVSGAVGGWLARWARRGDASTLEVAAPSEPSASEMAQRRRRLAFTGGISVLAALGLVWMGLSRPAAQRQAARWRADHVYFVPIHAAPELVDSLRDYYREQLGLEIEVLPAVQADALSYDPERRQLIGEELVRVLSDRYAHLTTDGRAVVMGITSWDMYLRSRPWQFAFGYRSAPYAVVSYARMHLPAARGDSPSDAFVLPRLRKTVTRYIGVLAFHIGLNSNRQSIMYQDIMGVDDLDRLDEDLAAAGFPVKPVAR